jgi:hypothetical protein
MPTSCDLHITPVFQEDPCNGERTLAQCVVDSSLYSELQLPANATQQQINQALYLAFLNLKSQLDAL